MPPLGREPPLHPQIFGVLSAYSRVLERSIFYGKCPLHFDKKVGFFLIKLHFRGYVTYYTRQLIAQTTFILPAVFVVARYLVNLATNRCQDNNVPGFVVVVNTAALILAVALVMLFVPLVFFRATILLAEKHFYWLLKRLEERKNFNRVNYFERTHESWQRMTSHLIYVANLQR